MKQGAASFDGQLIGFFCYGVNLENNEGMFQCIITNPAFRGKGYGKKMLLLGVKYAFEITNADSVQRFVRSTFWCHLSKKESTRWSCIRANTITVEAVCLFFIRLLERRKTMIWTLVP